MPNESGFTSDIDEEIPVTLKSPETSKPKVSPFRFAFPHPKPPQADPKNMAPLSQAQIDAKLAAMQANPTDCHVFADVNLRGGNLANAELKGQQFGRAFVAETDFRDANLSEADLSHVVGLQPAQLSGADLSLCKLPKNVERFETLENVGILSQNAGRVFVTAILSCIFVLLTTFSTNDIQLLTNCGTADLPVINVSVHTDLFFVIAPIVLTILSVGVHLYLQRLWETMATLPAIFPDGETVDNKTYPWLVNDQVRMGFTRLNNRPKSELSLLQLHSFSAIAYGAIPFTLLSIFLRCLAQHDKVISGIQAVAMALAFSWAMAMVQLHGATLRRDNTPRRYTGTFAFCILIIASSWLMVRASCSWSPVQLTEAQWRQANRWIDGTAAAGGRERLQKAYSLLNSISPARPNADIPDQILTETASLQQATDDLDKTVAAYKASAPVAVWKTSGTQSMLTSKLSTTILGILPAPVNAADIVEDTSQLTDKWKPGKDTDYPMPPIPQGVKSSAAAGKTAAGDQTELAKLLDNNYNLEPSASEYIYSRKARDWHDQVTADVKRSSFQKTNLRFLKAHGAFLVSADFRGAQMTDADFSDHADLRNALFDTTKPGAVLSFASFADAKLDGAGLAHANLTGADLARASMTGIDLSHAKLTGADLDRASLVGAALGSSYGPGVDLSNASLIVADMSNANLPGADLRGALMIAANANKADLSGSDLRGANFKSANFAGATLEAIDASKLNESSGGKVMASWQPVDFSNVDFTGADLICARLANALFAHAVLSNALLVDASLSGAHLENAVLSNADLSRADMSNADLTGADMSKAILISANLNGATLNHANLSNTDLSTASLIGACYLANDPPTWPDNHIPDGWRGHPMPISTVDDHGHSTTMRYIVISKENH